MSWRRGNKQHRGDKRKHGVITKNIVAWHQRNSIGISSAASWRMRRIGSEARRGVAASSAYAMARKISQQHQR